MIIYSCASEEYCAQNVIAKELAHVFKNILSEQKYKKDIDL